VLVAIIEYELNPDSEEAFTGAITSLLPEIEKIDGFISADPAQSMNHAGLLYEISYWRDAQALAAWSENALHRQAKQLGRERLLKWYRIRVGEVDRDWSAGVIPAAMPPAK